MTRTRVSSTQVRNVLKGKPYFLGINLYANEPTSGHHAVSITKGYAQEVITHLQDRGYQAGHAYAFGPYSESIWVKR